MLYSQSFQWLWKVVWTVPATPLAEEKPLSRLAYIFLACKTCF